MSNTNLDYKSLILDYKNVILVIMLFLIIVLLFNKDNFEQTTTLTYTPEFISIYDNILKKYKNKSIKILLLGSISQDKLSFINDYFKDTYIYIHSENKVIYEELPTNIGENNYDPYNLNEISNYNKNNIYFDIILTCGQISFDNISFIAQYYIQLLTATGIIIFENIDINNVSKLIDLIDITIKHPITIYDLRRTTGNFDSICLVLDKSI